MHLLLAPPFAPLMQDRKAADPQQDRWRNAFKEVAGILGLPGGTAAGAGAAAGRDPDIHTVLESVRRLKASESSAQVRRGVDGKRRGVCACGQRKGGQSLSAASSAGPAGQLAVIGWWVEGSGAGLGRAGEESQDGVGSERGFPVVISRKRVAAASGGHRMACVRRRCTWAKMRSAVATAADWVQTLCFRFLRSCVRARLVLVSRRSLGMAACMVTRAKPVPLARHCCTYTRCMGRCLLPAGRQKCWCIRLRGTTTDVVLDKTATKQTEQAR